MNDRVASISREQVRKDWSSRGFSCELWVDAPGSVWADFVHDEDERILLLEGSILLEMGGRVLGLNQGDEVTIPAGMRHTVRNVGPVPARWLYGYRTAANAG